jgi:hypothetical protein
LRNLWLSIAFWAICALYSPALAATPAAGEGPDGAEVLQQLEEEFLRQQAAEAAAALAQARAAASDAEAVRFYKEAAERGNAEAQLELGLLYRQRRGIQEEFRGKTRFSIDPKAFDFLFASKMDQQAFRWIKAAADQDIAAAQYYLAQFYQRGIGAPRDSERAEELFAQAAAKGFTPEDAVDLLKVEYDGVVQVISEPELEVAELSEVEAAEVQIISTTPDKTEIVSGNFTVTISAFSPLRSIVINEQTQPLDNGSFDVTYSLPYELEIGENYFDLEVETEATRIEREIIIFRETEAIKKPTPKPPFQLITIVGHTEDTNSGSAPDGAEKIRALKSNMVLVPSYSHYINYRNTFDIKGLITTDRQWMESQRSKEILLRQVSFEWVRKYTALGDLTTGVGTNQLGLRDVPETSPLRDGWSSDFRKVSADSFLFGKFKLETDNEVTWQGKLEHKWKNAEGSTTDDGVADKLELGSDFSINDWKYGGKLSYTLTDIQDDSKDKTDLKASFEVGVPTKPVALKIGHDWSQSEKRLENSDGVRQKDRKNVTSLGFTYPYAPWLIINFSRKLEQATSNLANKDYWKYQTALQLTVIYK